MEAPVVTARAFLDRANPGGLRTTVENGLSAYHTGEYATAEQAWHDAERIIKSLRALGAETEEIQALSKQANLYHLKTHIILKRARKTKRRIYFEELLPSLDIQHDSELLRRARRLYRFGRFSPINPLSRIGILRNNGDDESYPLA